MSFSDVLITGGTGFVGSWMRKTIPNGLTCLQTLNREDYESNYANWRGLSWDYVVHLAPIAPTRAIECARRNNARLLYCSSGIVYHPENDTEYRQNKIKWEVECLYSGVDVVIARLFTFWGSSQAQTALFTSARNGKPLEVWGDCTRSFMIGPDLGRAMWDILLNGESGRAYDVGSYRPVTILRLAKRIQAFTGCEIKYVEKDIPMPYYVPERK